MYLFSNIFIVQASFFSRSDKLGNLLMSAFELMRTVLADGLHSQVSTHVFHTNLSKNDIIMYMILFKLKYNHQDTTL